MAGLQPALAEEHTTGDPGPYIGVGVGYARADFGDICGRSVLVGLSLVPVTCEENGPAITGFAGFNLNKNLAVEGGFFYVGGLELTVSGTSADIDALGGYGAVVGKLPLGNLAPFVKLGVGLTRAEARVGDVELESDTTSLQAGAGVDLAIGENFGVRAEFVRPGSDLLYGTVGLTFRF